MVADVPVLVVAIIIIALLFDFVNGFHDAANAIATVVVSKTLTPFQAVLMSGVANFIGYFFIGFAVAKMIGKGVIYTDFVTLHLILSTLIGAVIWNIMTWFWGLPTSSSHALIGGLIGSTIMAAGTKAVIWAGVFKIFAFIFIAPLLGFFGAAIFTTLTVWIFRGTTPKKANTFFWWMQLAASLGSSIGHGTNDSQKTMGIIALTLFIAKINPTFHIDNWVALAAYASISVGTICGGWRIVKTMGTSITKIRKMEGFCSNAAAAIVINSASHFGIPVSTTHVVAGSIMGVGAVEHARTVRWVTARKIIWAWFLTIPAAALFAALSHLLLTAFNV